MERNKLPHPLQPFAAMIVDYSDERSLGDGIWVTIGNKLCFTSNPQCHVVHEDTFKELVSELQAVEPCRCKDCR
jgi:hypothetical protein